MILVSRICALCGRKFKFEHDVRYDMPPVCQDCAAHHVEALDRAADGCPPEPHSHNGIGQCGTDVSTW